MSQIRFRVQPNIHASLAAIARERKLEGGLNELCRELVTSFALDMSEFSKLDAISVRLDRLSNLVTNFETKLREQTLDGELTQRLQAQTAALIKIIKLLEAAGGSR